MAPGNRWGGEKRETAVFGRATMLSYPPQADGLNPLHGAHVKDIHPVLTVHCDVGGAATWCREAEPVSMSAALRTLPVVGSHS